MSKYLLIWIILSIVFSIIYSLIRRKQKMTFKEDYPVQIKTFVSAVETAKEESLLHKDHFIYLFKYKSGGYVIDYSGIVTDDVILIKTFRNGDETL